MNTFFVVALDRIKIKENLGRGDKISNDLLITNDTSIIDKYITEEFKAAIGNLEYEYLIRSNAIVYGLHSFEGNKAEINQAYIVYNLRKVQNFLKSLWISFDNAVDFNMGFLYVKSKNQAPMISSNNIAIIHTNSKCLNDEIIISREELRTPRLNTQKIWGEFDNFETYYSIFGNDDIKHSHQLIPFKNKGRLSRCFFMLSLARTEHLLPIKIAQYCICFECLFSTDNIELSHKVSERIAYFLSADKHIRIEVYENIRLAYRIRSIIVHGDVLSKKAGDLPQLSEKCDMILRSVITKILKNEKLFNLFTSDNKNELENFLLRMSLGFSD